MSSDTSEITSGQADRSFSGRKLSAELEAEVPDIESLVKADPRIISLRAEIKAARADRDTLTANRLVEENKQLTAQIRVELEQRSGVYVDSGEAELRKERARLDELATIKEHLSGEESDEELLSAFGLLDKEGRPQINSPLFRSNTQSAFATYIGAVRYWKAAVESGSAIHNQHNADLKRTEMHDEVARAIGSDLGLDFEAARRLAAKIRDAKIPGSGESRLYARKVNNELEKYGFDLSQFMQDQQYTLERTLSQQD